MMKRSCGKTIIYLLANSEPSGAWLSVCVSSTDFHHVDKSVF